MNSFRFGLLVGFVSGLVFTALWNSEPVPDAEAIAIVEEPPQEIEIAEIIITESQAE